MTQFFDERETRDAHEREVALFDRLPGFLQSITANIPGWRERLGGVVLEEINSRDALASLPVLRKPELMAEQSANPPFGNFIDEKLLAGTRVFMSPGPIWEPQGIGADPWNAARAFHAAGVRAGDIVVNTLSYHMTPGGFVLDEGARALGATVFPAGAGNTEAQVEAAAFIGATVYTGTPDFLKVMLERAEELGKDLSTIRRALVSGGALFPQMRKEYRQRGILVSQAYATADLGAIAFETWFDGAPCEGMVVNEDIIVEIVRPGTGEPVPEGEVGEVVVTNFNTAYPLIRFGTGDLSTFISAQSPCGYTNQRIAGWMGRADQRTKVKGMFVDPVQIDDVVKRCAQIKRARLIVSRENDLDVMTLQVIPANGTALDSEAIAQTLAEVTKLKGRVEVATSLPNDGKVIDDQRDYST